MTPGPLPLLIVPPSRVCLCGHAKRRHDLSGFEGECAADGCVCRAFIAATREPDGPAAIGAVVIPRMATVEAVVDAARRVLSDKRALLVIARIDALTLELRARVVAELSGQRDTALAERLRSELGVKAPSVTVVSTRRRASRDKACPTCGKDGLANVGAHSIRAHGHLPADPAGPALEVAQ